MKLMKDEILILSAVRVAAKMALVMSAILWINLPSVWADGLCSLLVVVLAMVGVSCLIRGLWQLICKLDEIICYAERKLTEREARQMKANGRAVERGVVRALITAAAKEGA